jgi:nitroreductase
MTERKPEYPINKMILNRQSKRAMSGESLSDEELVSLFEAARWAPSSFNAQPWRFVFAKRDSPQFKLFHEALMEGNRPWNENSSVLIILCSKKTDSNGRENTKHVFDAGAAWENLALEATSRGLVIHAMGGFDNDAARTAANVPEDYDVLIMITVGKPGKMENLPRELQEREQPSQRNPLKELVFENEFGNPY